MQTSQQYGPSRKSSYASSHNSQTIEEIDDDASKQQHAAEILTAFSNYKAENTKNKTEKNKKYDEFLEQIDIAKFYPIAQERIEATLIKVDPIDCTTFGVNRDTIFRLKNYNI